MNGQLKSKYCKVAITKYTYGLRKLSVEKQYDTHSYRLIYLDNVSHNCLIVRWPPLTIDKNFATPTTLIFAISQ